VFVLKSVEQATATRSEPLRKKEKMNRFMSDRRSAESRASDRREPGSQERDRDDDRDAGDTNGDRHQSNGPCPSTQG
jgi:hypothetical protein